MGHMDAVRNELIASSAVTALVGTRIFPQLAPQATALPFVVITVVSNVPEQAMSESYSTRLRIARVQIDSYAKGYGEVHAVADAINNVVANLSRDDLTATLETSEDLYDNETELRRVSSDYLVAL